MYHAYSELISKLKERKNHMFIPFAARHLLNKLKEDETIDEAMFNKSISKFYDKCFNYFEIEADFF